MTHFVWTSYLNTGHDMIDNDHRQLVNMINALYDAIAAGKDQDVMGKVLDEGRGQQLMGRALDALIVYYKVHFEREETEMLRIDYPKYLAHKLEHKNFMLEVGQLKKNFDGGVTLNPVFVGRMLSDWLRNHIAKVDTQLAVALNRTQ